MKEFLALLNAFDESDENDVALFHHFMEKVFEEALPELSDRLIRPSTPWALKRLIFASSGRYRSPNWTPILLRALMHESDLRLFEEGCRALTQIGGVTETDALRQIAWQRQEPQLQAIVTRKLAWLEPKQPFSYHFRDLLLGGQNPRLANQAGQHLVTIVQLGHLADLSAACNHPDSMVSRLAFKVISAIPKEEAGRFLIERFQDACEELLLDNRLRAAQEQIRRSPAHAVKAVLMGMLQASLGPEHAGALDEIGKALDDASSEPLPMVQRLKEKVKGLLEGRLVDCLADLALGHPVRLGNLMPEPPEEIRQRTVRLQGNLDECAEGMAMLTRKGVLEKDEVLALFQKAFEGNVGGDGLGLSFATILDVADQGQLDLILASPNHRWREGGITVMGERGDPSLLPFFLKAMGDPIVDIAQLATKYFGKLPGSFEVALDLFKSGKPDQIERALSIFSLNFMTQAGEALTEYLEHCEREDLLASTIRTLGVLHYKPGIDPLLSLLRGGQSSRLLKVLAETLVAMNSPEAAQGLLQKALELKNPEIHILALEGVLAAHACFEEAIALDEMPVVEQLLESCFREGGGHRMKAIGLLQNLWTTDEKVYERLEARLLEFVAEQKKRPSWDRDQQQLVSGVLRELERKRLALAGLGSKGLRLRELVTLYVSGEGASAGMLKDMKAALEEPDVFIGPDVQVELEALVCSELTRSGIDEESLLQLCQLARWIKPAGLRELLLELFHRSGPQSVLRRSCQEALLRLGLPEAAMKARPPIREVLVLDPSAFFRKRLVAGLQGGGWHVKEAQDRGEAQALLAEGTADIVIAELTDGTGDLTDWFRTHWQERRFRGVVLSTASRSAGEMRSRAWCMDALFKPYPVESLLALLEG